MRIIRFLLLSLGVLLIVSGLSFLLTREILLQWGVSQVQSSLSQLRQVSKNAGKYIQDCQKKGVIDPNKPAISSLHIRFTSDSDYVLEAVCAQFSLEPLVISQAKLPPFVNKVPGQSGIIWGEDLSGIRLAIWGRSRTVAVENLSVEEPSNGQELGEGPVTTCSGYGMQCCPLDSSLGEGDQIVTATDCPKSCYSRCQTRPQVLSFASQPFFDVETRQLKIAPGDSVDLISVVEWAGEPGVITLDFGDGEQIQTTESRDAHSHTYRCFQAVCTYTARVSVKNGAGLESASLRTSSTR